MNHEDFHFSRHLLRAISLATATDDLLRSLTWSVLMSHNVTSIVVMDLEGEEFQTLASHGASVEVLNEISVSNLSYLFKHALRNGGPLIFCTSEDFITEFPETEAIRDHACPSIFIPLETPGLFVGLAWLMFDGDVDKSKFSRYTLELIGMAIELEIEKIRSLPKSEAQGSNRLALNDRERRVARLAADGLTNYQIGKQLNISESWVKKLLTITFTKLGVNSRKELINLEALGSREPKV